ncbi:MAG: PAS domain-containing sensor histidine kinase [Devosiaceae bacterium]|nr:PAS domain-containing sensor histidine kinase [Devosiaceae bacterium MH13]
MPEKRLSDLCEWSDLLDVPIFILAVLDDERLEFRKLNRYHEQVTGMSNDAVVGKSPHEFLPKRFADNITAKYMTCVRSRARHSYEEVLNLPNGEIWWDTTLSPIIFDDGRLIGILGVAVDITARKVRELEDAQALSNLKQLNEETAMYTSMAAHDVRGPLRKIRMIGDLVLNADNAPVQPDGSLVLRPEQVTMLRALDDIADKTLAHIDNILSYARALTVGDDPTPDNVDLGLLLMDLASLQDAGGHFEFRYPAVTVRAERLLLELTLRNLMENAQKHGKPPCEITVAPSAADPEMLEFRVSDQGDGFSNPAVFATEENAPPVSAVSGFGLASAQRIVESRGGSIWVEEGAAGTGATVRFTTRGTLVEREKLAATG